MLLTADFHAAKCRRLRHWFAAFCEGGGSRPTGHFPIQYPTRLSKLNRFICLVNESVSTYRNLISSDRNNEEMCECNYAVRGPWSFSSVSSQPSPVSLSDHFLLFVFLNLFLIFLAINFVNPSGHVVGLFPVYLEQNPPILVSF